MTRKDYIQLAAGFALTRPLNRNELPQSSNKPARFMRNQWLQDRAVVADVFARDNPRFDRETFYEATEA